MSVTSISSFLPENLIWKGLTLTASAAKQIHYLIEKNPNIKGIRLEVKNAGCAGLKYVMNMVNDLSNEDLQFLQFGIKLFVPLKSMPFMDGTQLDYVSEGLNQVFKFNNPKAQHFCGCGASFNIE
ncbi:Fe-S cluster assembly scaffold SufA [Pantoea sp. Mhis]|uniref:Fe-S cluster assembly scaffold SufA n=1 Tax=Pantoea sp. Mhis TaxID=2576759 RepID=UPI001358D881|nr:Fe-S cluster assembly scaffold SufA [Pantoea sp. Mhis]MXP56215.1 Fe-S cluster assembly scaffold SufA [Pantoea sp. Mhis]